MIFLDANVWMYAVGANHPLRADARDVLRRSVDDGVPVAVSTDVLQELLHVYLRRRRDDLLGAALDLVLARAVVWPVEVEDVLVGRDLAVRFTALTGRDLVHLAVCIRRDVDELVTFDRALAAAWDDR